MYKSLIFDFETMDNRPSSIVLDLSAVLFNENETDDFADIVNDKTRTFSVKFDTKTQSGRTVSKDTLDWWKTQSDEARKILYPSKDDVPLYEGIVLFKKFIEKNGFDMRYGRGYVRGASFDFPVMSDIVETLFNSFDMGYSMFPVAFWNQHDIRTASRWSHGSLDERKSPVPKGTMDTFVKHNSLHDCCKDVMVLQTAFKITNCLEIDSDYDFV